MMGDLYQFRRLAFDPTQPLMSEKVNDLFGLDLKEGMQVDPIKLTQFLCQTGWELREQDQTESQISLIFLKKEEDNIYEDDNEDDETPDEGDPS